MQKRRSVQSGTLFPADPAPLWETHNVFSDHYLRERLPRSSFWPTDEASEPIRQKCQALWDKVYFGLTQGHEAKTRHELIDKVLNILGFEFLPNETLPTSGLRKEPDYLLFADQETKDRVFAQPSIAQFEAAVAVLEAKRLKHNLGEVSKKETPGRFGHQQIRDYLSHATDISGRPFFRWAILTNGKLWRLYCRDAPPDDYFELNFERAIRDSNEFKTFISLFSPVVFAKDAEGRCGLDEIRDAIESVCRSPIDPYLDLAAPYDQLRVMQALDAAIAEIKDSDRPPLFILS